MQSYGHKPTNNPYRGSALHRSSRMAQVAALHCVAQIAANDMGHSRLSVQRRAATWVIHDYRLTSSLPAMLGDKLAFSGRGASITNWSSCTWSSINWSSDTCQTKKISQHQASRHIHPTGIQANIM